jgi:hypothetical protein
MIELLRNIQRIKSNISLCRDTLATKSFSTELCQLHTPSSYRNYFWKSKTFYSKILFVSDFFNLKFKWILKSLINNSLLISTWITCKYMPTVHSFIFWLFSNLSFFIKRVNLKFLVFLKKKSNILPKQLRYISVGSKTNRKQFLAKFLRRKAINQKIECIICVKKYINKRLYEMLAESISISFKKKAHPKLYHA